MIVIPETRRWTKHDSQDRLRSPIHEGSSFTAAGYNPSKMGVHMLREATRNASIVSVPDECYSRNASIVSVPDECYS
jgi:hypothetical protein